MKRLSSLAALVAVALLVWWWLGRHKAPTSAPPPVAGAPAALAAEERTPAARPIEPLRLSPAVRGADGAATHGALRGRVISWGDQRGVGGAELTFFSEGASHDVVADASGEFEFVAPAARTYQLAAVAADGFVPFTPSLGQSHVRFTARPGVRVSGVIVYLTPLDAYDGVVVDEGDRPIAGARVEVLELAAVDQALASRESVATSNAKGEVQIDAPANYTLLATHPGYAPTRLTLGWNEQATRTFTVRMRAHAESGGTASISGVVLDPSGRPFEGALVRAFGDGGWHGGAEAGAVTSDERGRFVFASLPRGRYALLATSSVHARARGSATTGQSDVKLQLEAGGDITGRVTGEHGPIVSFSIVAEMRRGWGQRVQSFFDAEGTFTLAALPPGDYEVRALAHGYAASEPQRATVTVGGRADLDLRLVRGTRIHGRVIAEEDGQPIAGASVSSENAMSPGDAPAAVAARVVTDADGRFELEGLTLGLRSIMVQAPGRHTRLVSGLSIEAEGDIGPLTIDLIAVPPGEEPRIEVTGIGGVLESKDGALVFARVMQGGGAAGAGLSPGDAILAIDGTATSTLEYRDAIEKIRGPEGSTVRLTVRKKDESVEQEIVVRRRRIR